MEDTSFLIDSKNESFKESILIELGRLEDEEDIKLVANHVCKRAKAEKRTVHQWATIVQTIRMTRQLISETVSETI